MLELERVFMVRELPDHYQDCDYVEIVQHYLVLPHSTRLRKQSDYTSGNNPELQNTEYTMVQKRRLEKHDKKRREENTIILDSTTYKLLLKQACTQLKKTRWLIPIADGLVAELDVFRDNLEGLIWVEVEFTSEEAMVNFTPPSWFGREISDEEWASSSWVAGKTFEEIKHHLV